MTAASVDPAESRKQDEQQAQRIQQVRIAAAAYAIAIPLLFFAYLAKLIGGVPATIAVGMMLLANATYFLLFKTGANLRFADPSMTQVQTVVGIVFTYSTAGLYGVFGLVKIIVSSKFGRRRGRAAACFCHLNNLLAARLAAGISPH